MGSQGGATVSLICILSPNGGRDFHLVRFQELKV